MLRPDADEAIAVLFTLIKEFGLDAEPMFVVSDKSKDIIDSFLGVPFQTFGGVELYPTREEKSAVLFYDIIKDHKLENGNKRTAVILTLYFLLKNGCWLKIDRDALYNLALDTAKSSAIDKDAVMQKLTKTFQTNIIEIKPRWRLAFNFFTKK
ncbi:MAG: type II toxin-antitoxin system death-on-curing family toxin [Candidatus Nomurabacteria bacterium]|jgi:prophage maintenance system killer protein|nr:type II toxin-antitoxin system death-on-curing family toxin [Candidatus Nomurabacteria bacterium]